ncbi:MAG: hypothetical protein ALECFALPRED_010538 [Alectoria fallacina]|uniref:Cytochrome b5 heme-binding domain-containing protein n=1 Tax=Alectoria fallacina TaxID=1903189 RepID=A0A8H3F8G6_9LECA|nr:MAG: hypothetical protein ALECFALPRED_010538 [Alectoria fallacina]
MVLFGLGILLLSVSVIIYRNQSTRLSARTGKQDPGKTGARSPIAEPERNDEGARNRPEIPKVTLDGGENEKNTTAGGFQKDRQATNAITCDTKPKPSIPLGMSPPSPNYAMPPPPRPSSNAKRKPETTLIPPPPNRSSTLRAAPTLSTTLRPPPSIASSLRAPRSRSLAPSTSSLSTSTLSPSTRPSKKVLLDPGHSPLDWAHLTTNPPTPTFLRGADVPPQLIRVPPSALNWHNGRKGRDAWGVWQGKVYNLTPYMKFHPGGVGELMRGAGKVGDGERLFNEVHPWVSWENMLGECLVGILVSENEVTGKEGNDLEEID